MALWADLSRSASPASPALMIRRPYRNHALVDIEEHALLSVLPEYARESFRRPYDADAIIEQLIMDSPELWPTTKFNALQHDDIYDVYCWIIRTTSRASGSNFDKIVEEGVLEGLEESFRHDRRGIGGLQQSFYHRRTQRLFRALADVSDRTRSVQLGTVLIRFFLSHASQIAATDASDALGQWCFAILRAHAHEVDQHDCLRQILRERPDLPSRLIGRGRKAEQVLERLELLTSRGESISFRDLVGAERTSDLLSLDYGRYSRSRSSSRDRPFLLRSQSSTLGDRQGLGLRRRESDEDSLRFLLSRHDALKQEQRRMLQLRMGRRYADRFDRPQPLGLGALTFGGDLGLLHYDDVEI